MYEIMCTPKCANAFVPKVKAMKIRLRELDERTNPKQRSWPNQNKASLTGRIININVHLLNF